MLPVSTGVKVGTVFDAQWWFHTGAGGGHRPSKLWLGRQNLALLLAHCDQLLILGKLVRIFDATRCQILRLKCTTFNFRCDSTPDPAGGAYNAPQTL